MADPRDAELAALRRDVESLRALVAALDEELRRAQGRVSLTMRNQQRCPACGQQKIGHALSVLDHGESDSRKKMALYRGSWWSSKTQGEMEAFVCMSCGLVEWWVKAPDKLEPHEDYFLINSMGSDDKAGPYR